jgi:hypothetical protein
LSASNLLDREVSLDLQLLPSLKARARAQSKLDSLAWTSGLSLVAYGVHVGIRCNDAKAVEECLPYLPIGWKPSSSRVVDRIYSILVDNQGSSGRRPGFYLYKDNRMLLRSTEKEPLFERLESDMALYVADTSRQRVFVHAGVVGWDSRAILIPGKSFAGKTTLVADLVRLGATYYSDEFAVLDHRGLVHPYARPLQLREDGGFRQTKRAVEELGGVAGCVPLPVGLILLSRYKTGAKWRPRHISAGQAFLGLLDNTVSARRDPAVALKTLKQVVGDCFAVKGFRGESREVVDWISKYFHPQKMFAASSK